MLRVHLHVNYLPSVYCVCMWARFMWPRVFFVIQGGKEFLMRAHFGLPSVERDEMEGKPPITVKFEIPYFTVSGIQVCKSESYN